MQPIFIDKNKSQNLVTCEYSRSLYSQNRIYSFELALVNVGGRGINDRFP